MNQHSFQLSFDSFAESHNSISSSFGGSTQRCATREEVQLLSERLFAQEKQLQRHAMDMKEIVQRHEMSLHALELKLDNDNAMFHPAVAQVGPVDNEYAGSITNVEIEEKLTQIEARLMQVDTRQKTLEQEQEAQQKRLSNSFRSNDNTSPGGSKSHTTAGDTASLEEGDSRLNSKVSFDLPSERSPTTSLPKLPAPTESTRTLVSKLTYGAARTYTRNLQDNPEYTLTPSVWDLLLFIGTRELRTGGSIICVILALCNAFMQICFVMVCTANFMDPDIGPEHVSAAQYFRISLSHDQRFVDAATQTSLARRLCDPNFHMAENHIATAQFEILDDIEGYLAQNGGAFQRIWSGYIMSNLAICCWSMTVLLEIHHIFNFCAAIAALPRNNKNTSEGWTEISVRLKPDPEDRFHLLIFENVHYMRFFMVIGSILLRACIAGNLLFCGCVWLATTVEVSEMLLNAVALEFIMQLDELIYAAFVPGHARALINSFKPLKRKHWKDHRGFEWKSGIMFCCVPVAMTAFYWGKTRPMIDDMEAVVAWLCDPPLDFAFGTDAFKFVQLAGTQPKSEFADITAKAVREALDKKVFSSLTFSFNPTGECFSYPSGDGRSVEQVIDLTFSETVNMYNPACKDLLPSPGATGATITTYMAELFGKRECPEVKGSCLDFASREGALSRAFCPVTCGCNRPDSELPVASPKYGCPSACQLSNEWQAARNNAPCFNPTITELNKTSYWPEWVKYITTQEISQPALGPAMAKHGCNFAKSFPMSSSILEAGLCSGTLSSGLKPIAIACPQTCCSTSTAQESHCRHGPASVWCPCLSYLDTILSSSKAPRDAAQCRDLVCERPANTWAEAERYVGQKYKEVLGKDTLENACS